METIIRRSLAQHILQPRAIAIVGASDDASKTTARPQQFLEHSGFGGAKYFINPRRETVQGAKAWPSLSALPEVPDHVYIMTGAEHAIEAVRECADLGIPVATILASGFGEAGPQGQQREARLVEAAAGKVRLIGPSSLGVVNPRNGLLLTGNAAFGESDVPKGGIFVASQSGSIIGALVSRARGRGIGFAGLVSVGGEADLSVGTICQAVLDDPEVTSFALFLESLSHAEDLAAFALAAAEAGKPVAVYKLGRSDAAAELSVSHTGALAGSDAEAEAFFQACGFARVNHFEGLLEIPALLQHIPAQNRTSTPRIGVVTTTGGGAAIMVDQIALNGLNVVAPSEDLLRRMAKVEVEVPHSLIVDLGLAGTRADVVSKALTLMQDSGEFDLIVFTIGSSARLNPELAVQSIAANADHQVPVVAFTVPAAPAAAELLNTAGVPTFRTPEACGDALKAAFSRRPATISGRTSQHTAQSAQVLDEAVSAQVLTDLGVPVAGSIALEVGNLDIAFALPFDYPVVVKVLSEQIPHKSDVGGVILDVQNDKELLAAVGTIQENVARHLPEIPVERVLVQQMATKGLADALLGYRVSNDVGPLVVLSTGGVLAELFEDSSVRLAPVDLATAHEMIGEVRGLAPVTGYRNLPLGDTDALAHAIVAMSNLATTHPDVIEAEANPLQIKPQGEGVLALDALVRSA
jgi:acetate---CoA ligase (ADP-forming)